MYVPFSLFVIAIVLILIFWELSKINSLLKKTLGSFRDNVKDTKTIERP